jgi:hypothetical protein
VASTIGVVGLWLVTAAGRFHVVAACTLLLGMYTYPVAAWYLLEPCRRIPRRVVGGDLH